MRLLLACCITTGENSKAVFYWDQYCLVGLDRIFYLQLAKKRFQFVWLVNFSNQLASDG